MGMSTIPTINLGMRQPESVGRESITGTIDRFMKLPIRHYNVALTTAIYQA